ncbi:7613_t:CDS:1, partial [Funneliformis caledonium]
YIATSCLLRYLNLTGYNSITIKSLNYLKIHILRIDLDFEILDKDSWFKTSSDVDDT